MRNLWNLRMVNLRFRMRQHPSRNGYSLIELIILFVVLTIVSIFIWVNRQYFIPNPPPGAEAVTAELVRMAINNYALESQVLERQPLYPRVLDGADIGTVASDWTPLFTHVLPEGIRSTWKKVGANQYVFQQDGASKKVEIDDIYFYDPGSGSFGKGELYRKSLTARRTYHLSHFLFEFLQADGFCQDFIRTAPQRTVSFAVVAG